MHCALRARTASNAPETREAPSHEARLISLASFVSVDAFE
jgi:hypothetical protein